jgi:predicted heme/steroid binding protein
MPVEWKGGNHVALHKGGSVLDKKQNEQPKDKFGMTTPAGLK